MRTTTWMRSKLGVCMFVRKSCVLPFGARHVGRTGYGSARAQVPSFLATAGSRMCLLILWSVRLERLRAKTRRSFWEELGRGIWGRAQEKNKKQNEIYSEARGEGPGRSFPSLIRLLKSDRRPSFSLSLPPLHPGNSPVLLDLPRQLPVAPSRAHVAPTLSQQLAPRCPRPHPTLLRSPQRHY